MRRAFGLLVLAPGAGDGACAPARIGTDARGDVLPAARPPAPAPSSSTGSPSFVVDAAAGFELLIGPRRSSPCIAELALTVRNLDGVGGRCAMLRAPSDCKRVSVREVDVGHCASQRVLLGCVRVLVDGSADVSPRAERVAGTMHCSAWP